MKGLKVIFLGGVGEIGKNMTALEFKDEIIIIDAGMSFPTPDMPGVDLVVPDTEYLVENSYKVQAYLLTHGHEDHIGALPYILREVNAPIYAGKLTLGLLENKFKEHRVDNLETHNVKAGDVVQLGKYFKAEFIKVNHSITNSFAIAITTPVGVVFHTGDFKVDFTPVDDEVIDLHRIAEIGSKGVLLMLGESTNVERDGFSMSESSISESFNHIFQLNATRRLVIATFASNIHRIQQILDMAARFKRKVAFSGRSMLNVVDVATRLGELRYDPDIVVEIDRIKNIRDKDLVIITTGSQGEPMSALTRMAANEFREVKITGNDTVVISASPIPGNERQIYGVINNLCKMGAHVLYESLENVHVSGHACLGELKLMLNLVKPKFFAPIHGEFRHLKRHVDLAVRMGIPARNTFIPEIGSVLEVNQSKMARADSVAAGQLFVDGGRVGDVGTAVLKDRKKMSEDGMVIVVLTINQGAGEVVAAEIVSRGFVYIKENGELFEQSKEIVRDAISDFDLKQSIEWGIIKERIVRDLRKHYLRETGRNPMIIPFITEV